MFSDTGYTLMTSPEFQIISIVSADSLRDMGEQDSRDIGGQGNAEAVAPPTLEVVKIVYNQNAYCNYSGQRVRDCECKHHRSRR